MAVEDSEVGSLPGKCWPHQTLDPDGGAVWTLHPLGT
jgi:hypothetical protein